MGIVVIPVTFRMSGEYSIEAETIEEAVNIVLLRTTGLPVEKDYLEDSLQIDYEGLAESNDIAGSNIGYRCPLCDEICEVKEWNQATLSDFNGKISYLEDDDSDLCEFTCPICSRTSLKMNLVVETGQVNTKKHMTNAEFQEHCKECGGDCEEYAEACKKKMQKAISERDAESKAVNKINLIKALEEFQKACTQLDYAWSLEGNVDLMLMDKVLDKYPFAKSFDEVSSKVCNWTEVTIQEIKEA